MANPVWSWLPSKARWRAANDHGDRHRLGHRQQRHHQRRQRQVRHLAQVGQRQRRQRPGSASTVAGCAPSRPAASQVMAVPPITAIKIGGIQRLCRSAIN